LIKIFQKCSMRKKIHSFDNMIIVADEFLDSILRDLQLESKIKTYKILCQRVRDVIMLSDKI